MDVCGQQKANDFTKRVGSFEGKMSSLSGRSSKFNRINSSSTYRRISLEDWPKYFSPFGGRRFPIGNAKILGKERISTSKIEIEKPLNQHIANENFLKADSPNLFKRDPAANSVEFRDAYYAQLNDRVDEWMEKVNNMSLRDINRYQFRRDRPNKPGFPVQRAGAAGMNGARSEATVKGSGLPSVGSQSLPMPEKYWMGPTKTKSTNSSVSSSPSGRKAEHSLQNESVSPSRNFKATPKPILGPKTIRVEVATP